MSYISQEDYKKMMEGFKKGAPKGLLKEELEQEGNAFTAGLAKAKKGQEFKVGDKSVKDTSNYDASVNEYQFDDMYQDDPGPFEEGVCPKCGMSPCECTMEESHPANDEWLEAFKEALLDMYDINYPGMDAQKMIDKYGDMTPEEAAARYVQDEQGVDWPAQAGAYEDYDDDFPADYGDAGADFNDGEFWENEVKKLQEIAGVKSHDDGPEDDDTEEREARAKKEEMDDEEAENAERDLDEEEEERKPNMHSEKDVAKVVAQKHPELKAMFDEYLASHEKYMQMTQKSNYANDPEFRAFVKEHNALWKKIENAAISWAGHEMLEAGMKRVTVQNLLSAYGYFEDWIPDYLDALKKELKGVAEGLHMPPLQATGPTVDVNEDQAPYGFSVLSPDERKQLKEYINSYKTIKSEIAKLLEKSGRSGKIMESAADDEAVPAARKAVYRDPTTVPTQHKHSNLGGNRTGLVMTKAEMWEGADRMEDIMNIKLKEAFEKVTGLIMKDLMEDGFTEGDIKLYLDHIIEEKAREMAMSQYDF